MSDNAEQNREAKDGRPAHRYGMAVDLDRCNGCGACMLACAVENNVAPVPEEADDRKGVTWIRVYKASNGAAFPEARTVYLPVLCQQCGHETPCVAVCPQQAVDVDPETGIVSQMPERCLGCRYCMAACPYHARYFNWWDPVWPEGLAKTLNPAVSPRMRGVVEKCNLCHARLQAARAKAAAEGRREAQPEDYQPACVEACPTGALTFGDLADPDSQVSRLARSQNSFRLLERLRTDPKIYYHSNRRWVHELAERGVSRT
ncbi:MAG: 4Fe-4S dicluster domain-containing protein [Acidobacteriota bacterium]